MKFDQITAVYFSATGTTERVVTAIADALSERLHLPVQKRSFTLPQLRTEPLRFSDRELVICGTPTYAGRVPNVLLPYLRTIEGAGAAAVPVVLFGNRDFDDSLIELRDLLENGGCHTLAAAAFVGEHSFSDTLAQGRPDAEDLSLAAAFAGQIAEKLSTWSPDAPPIAVDGTPAPYRGYYQPRDRAGHPVDIRKVKPKTNENCDNCGKCAELCPMGSISAENVREFTGICIKCGACIKGCPKHAKYYDDAGYLYHKTELEEGLKRRAQVRVFL